MRRPYRSWHRQLGRLGLYAHSHSLALPYVSVMADGDYVSVALGIGAPGGDPAVMADVDLSGTVVGRAVSAVYWRRWPTRRQ